MHHMVDWNSGGPIGPAIAATLGGFEYSLKTANQLKVMEADLIQGLSSYSDVASATALAEFRQCVACFTKNPLLPGSTPEIRVAAAVEKFHQVERKQRRVTRKLRHYLNRRDRMSPTMRTVLNEMRYDIFKLLGPSPTWGDLEFTIANATWGPGTCGGLKLDSQMVRSNKDTTPFGKLGPHNVIQCTKAALQYWGPLLTGEFRSWLNDQQATIVDYCRGTTVPKDASTDRFIATEPYLNVYLQLGQKALLQERLRRWGISLTKQEKNQRLCRLASHEAASFPDGWATLDLSSASDSVNRYLVEWLLPKYWYTYISSTRCSHIVIGSDNPLELHKFSSMGNGVTFPLECLVFGAVVRACRRVCGDKTAFCVYGDDIIVGHRSAALVVETLQYLGFDLNLKKSFITGRFKESCGKDFLGHNPVRPVFLKPKSNHLADLFAFANALQQSDTSMARRLFAAIFDYSPPFYGPATSPDGISHSYLVAPPWFLHQEGMIKRERPKKSPLKPYTQSDYWVGPAFVRVQRVVSAKKKASRVRQAYLASLACAMPSDPHFIREQRSKYLLEPQLVVPFYWHDLQYDSVWYSKA